MILTKANINDLDEVYGVIEIGRKHIATFNIDQWQDGDPSYETIKENILKNEVHILKDEDEIVGCFVKQEYDPQYEYIEGKWLDDSKYVVIHRMAVKYYNRGLGTYIFNELKKEYNHIRIDTHEGNKDMNCCLVKNGFTLCGTIYLKNGHSRNAYEYIKKED